MRLSVERLSAWGAVLTLVILASSVLLRLATRIDDSGTAFTVLPESMELTARVAHRLSAMAAGLLAILVALGVASARPVPRTKAVAAVAIVALTVLLALVGRYTPGYRITAITVGNVVGGMALACAFWWLREEYRAALRGRGDGGSAALVAIAALLVHAGVEAAASALALHGKPFSPVLHVATGAAVVVVAAFCTWRERPRGDRAAAYIAATAVGVQFVCTIALDFPGSSRPAIAAWLHPMAGAIAALGFVSLAVGSRTESSNQPGRPPERGIQ